MKKLGFVLIAVLIGWNMVLTQQLWGLKQQKQGNNEQGNVSITSGHTEITSDVSELVSKSENKVVSVIATMHGQTIGTGSGAIYRVENGEVFVVTNHHVIDGGDGVEVLFADNTSVPAEVVGSDALTDLAVLKMKTSSKVEAFTIGDSSLVKKGEYVIAMGSPLGIAYQGSVSGGLISGVNRIVSSADGQWDMNVLQIDAAINPGNSGGPLINMAGELIGINSMKISDTEVEGFGFAIPINEVIPIVQQLEKNKEVIRPNLGISGIDLAQLSVLQRIRENIKDENGIMITHVYQDSPADKAGLAVNDIIVEIDGKEITSLKVYRQMMYAKQIGDKATLTILRNQKKQTVEVTLE